MKKTKKACFAVAFAALAALLLLGCLGGGSGSGNEGIKGGAVVSPTVAPTVLSGGPPGAGCTRVYSGGLVPEMRFGECIKIVFPEAAVERGGKYAAKSITFKLKNVQRYDVPGFEDKEAYVYYDVYWDDELGMADFNEVANLGSAKPEGGASGAVDAGFFPSNAESAYAPTDKEWPASMIYEFVVHETGLKTLSNDSTVSVYKEYWGVGIDGMPEGMNVTLNNGYTLRLSQVVADVPVNAEFEILDKRGIVKNTFRLYPEGNNYYADEETGVQVKVRSVGFELTRNNVNVFNNTATVFIRPEVAAYHEPFNTSYGSAQQGIAAS